MKLQLCALFVLLVAVCPGALFAQQRLDPVPLIFDTDIGNDVDDVLALGMIHSLQSRGECELLAVTITKDHELAAPFVDAVNTFYGRGDIPIGVCRSGVTPAPGKFNLLATQRDNGKLRYPHDLTSGNDAPDAVAVLRKSLADAKDGSVVIAQVGFSTNLANLLSSKADRVSPLSGAELIKQKVRLLSIMAGGFTNGRGEYNLIKDIPSAKVVVADWPTPMVWSGYAVGLSLAYPHQSILRDYGYVEHHPLVEAYMLYQPPPHDRPTWDLTSVLYGVRPDHGYFELSEPGQVLIADDGVTTFKAAANGRDRYILVRDDLRFKVLEALQLLSSQPPSK
ncbi:Inosine-uridine preferring nucleoside hydrolase [Novipirellula galeiformis]|uniref:Inosine-uridine preferring nucleoside hydrolase n=1 Tax=Novipirellula galeiformis TaxID=2528004 RepID=A0A5C6C8V7_9BACT|nr:nucleoside hydrolase [Novipirellula galeiformis]TWU20437.1 Inosine-uridine preferring nucleoside hydrolase [Novipirellula galeiformis]